MFLAIYHYLAPAMKKRKYQIDLASLLDFQGEMTVKDIKAAYPEMPMTSVYALIRAMRAKGLIHPSGKGRYIRAPKPKYQIEITPWMREISSYLTENLVGVNHCIYEKGRNLIVETDKIDLHRVVGCLKGKYPDVALRAEAAQFEQSLKGYILVGQLVSESPLVYEGGCQLPSLEKSLVDNLVKEGPALTQPLLQRAMESHPVNISRMQRYASRRKVGSELADCLHCLDQVRIEMFSQVQNYLATIPVTQAWVFGSFARGEENPSSDLDLLVTYDKDAKVSLLSVIRYKLDLKNLIGRDVDLVEDGYLKPFAVPSAERDKYLIYER